MTSCSDIQEKKCILHTFQKDNKIKVSFSGQQHKGSLKTMVSSCVLTLSASSMMRCLLCIIVLMKMAAAAGTIRSFTYKKTDFSDLMIKAGGNIYCKSLSLASTSTGTSNNLLKCVTRAQTYSAWITARNSSHCLACFYLEVGLEYKRFNSSHDSLHWIQGAG